MNFEVWLMDIFTIRQKLRTTRLSDIALRVTFYARVSTDSDEQLNSLDNQISYYRDYITRNPAWTFIDGYIDEGLSNQRMAAGRVRGLMAMQSISKRPMQRWKHLS